MSNRDIIVAFFERKGLTRAQASGIAGNLMQESSDNPNAPGGGLDQGQGGRAHGGTLVQQLEAIWTELIGGERGSLQALRATSTPEQAARVFSERFERPGEPMIENRERYAREAFGGGTFHNAGILELVPGFGGPAAKNLEKGLGNILPANPLGSLSGIESFFGSIEKIFEPAFWIKVGKVTLGVFLLLAGVLGMANVSADPTAVVEHGKKAAELAAIAL